MGYVLYAAGRAKTSGRVEECIVPRAPLYSQRRVKDAVYDGAAPEGNRIEAKFASYLGGGLISGVWLSIPAVP